MTALTNRVGRTAAWSALATVAISGLLLSAPAIAFNPQPEPPAHSVPFSLVGPESAQINVVNIGAATCEVTVNVDDLTGTTVRTATTRLAPGHGVTEVLPPRDGTTRRNTFYTWYTWRPVDGRECAVATSVEVVDGYGSSKFVLPGERFGFNPQPEPPAADH